MDKNVSARLRTLAGLAARDGICVILTRWVGVERGFRARAYYGRDHAKDFEEAAPTLVGVIAAVADRLHGAGVKVAAAEVRGKPRRRREFGSIGPLGPPEELPAG